MSSLTRPYYAASGRGIEPGGILDQKGEEQPQGGPLCPLRMNMPKGPPLIALLSGRTRAVIRLSVMKDPDLDPALPQRDHVTVLQTGGLAVDRLAVELGEQPLAEVQQIITVGAP